MSSNNNLTLNEKEVENYLIQVIDKMESCGISHYATNLNILYNDKTNKYVVNDPVTIPDQHKTLIEDRNGKEWTFVSNNKETQNNNTIVSPLGWAHNRNILVSIPNEGDNINEFEAFEDFDYQNRDFFDTWTEKTINGDLNFIYKLSHEQDAIVDFFKESNVESIVYQRIVLNIKYNQEYSCGIHIVKHDGKILKGGISNIIRPVLMPDDLFKNYVLALRKQKDQVCKEKRNWKDLLINAKICEKPEVPEYPKIGHSITNDSTNEKVLRYFLDNLNPCRFFNNRECIDVGSILHYNNKTVKLFAEYSKKAGNSHDVKGQWKKYNKHRSHPLFINTLAYWASLDNPSINSCSKYDKNIAHGQTKLIEYILNSICYKGISRDKAARVFYHYKNYSKKYVFDPTLNTFYQLDEEGLYQKDEEHCLLNNDISTLLTDLVSNYYENRKLEIKQKNVIDNKSDKGFEGKRAFVEKSLNELQQPFENNMYWLKSRMNITSIVTKLESMYSNSNTKLVSDSDIQKDSNLSHVTGPSKIIKKFRVSELSCELKQPTVPKPTICEQSVVHSQPKIPIKSDVLKQPNVTELTNVPELSNMSKWTNFEKHLITFENGVYDMLANKLISNISCESNNMTTGYSYCRDLYTDETKNSIMDAFRQIIPDAEELDYVLASLSYCLRGENNSGRFFVWFGGRIKNIIAEFVSLCLGKGTYCQNMDSSYFIKDRNGNGDRPLRADSKMVARRHCRCIFTGDIKKDSNWHVSKLNEITGKGIICRQAGCTDVFYTCFWPLFMLTNNLPKMPKGDTKFIQKCTIIEFPKDDTKGLWKSGSKNINNKRYFDLINNMNTDEWKITFFHILIEYYDKHINLNKLPKRFQKDWTKELNNNAQIEMFIKNKLKTQKEPIEEDEKWNISGQELYKEFKKYTLGRIENKDPITKQPIFSEYLHNKGFEKKKYGPSQIAYFFGLRLISELNIEQKGD